MATKHVEIFSKTDFEAALPSNGKPLWKCLGVQESEYAYLVPVSAHAGIVVRSSVKASGMSADSGEDSIRCWLVGADGKTPVGSKLSRWTTRLPGWQVRLQSMLRRMWKLAQFVKPCSCGGLHVVRKVKKEGPNKGRLFVTCQCQYFHWIAEEEDGTVRLVAA